MGHVHVRHCSDLRGLLGTQGRIHIQRFSAISVINCKSVFDFVSKPGAPTGTDDTRCATDLAIIRRSLRRMGVTLRWRPTGLMLGNGLSKNKADAAVTLRACVRALALQMTDESSTLQRIDEQRDANSARQLTAFNQCSKKRTAGKVVPGKSHGRLSRRKRLCTVLSAKCQLRPSFRTPSSSSPEPAPQKGAPRRLCSSWLSRATFR